MKAPWRLTAVRPAALRLALVPALALATFIAPDRTAPTPADLPAESQQSDAIAGAGGAESADLAIRQQGRLRKLHLVRPDLIPYPIAYEVYC